MTPMTLTVNYQGGTKFGVRVRQHTLIQDQPIDAGGTDEGPSPVEVFMGSLAGCVGYFVARFCQRHAISAQGLSIEAEWAYAEHPHRVGSVALTVTLPEASLTPDQQEKLLKVAHGCTVHQSLLTPPELSLVLHDAGASPSPAQTQGASR